jgi:hypothetical protein
MPRSPQLFRLWIDKSEGYFVEVLMGKRRGAVPAAARLLLWWSSKMFMVAFRIRRNL